MFNLNGKAALVTGSGRGIGRSIATMLAQAGASVMLNDLDQAPLDEAVTAIQATGGTAHGLAGSVTAPEFPQQLVDATVENFGAIDILVNNAGYAWDNVIQKMSDAQFQAMLDIHLVAPFRLLRAASGWIRETAKREKAEGKCVMRKVVNITSISGTDGNAGQTGYAAGKAGIIGVTKTLAKEWGRYNVNVNAVGFGVIQTRMNQAMQPGSSIEVEGRKIASGVPAERLEIARQACPLGRLGTAEEAAGSVLFFCSPLSDYVTGEVLICGGGVRL